MAQKHDWGEATGVIFFWLFVGGLLMWWIGGSIYSNYKVYCGNTPVLYQLKTVDDTSADIGTTTVETKGVNGVNKVCTRGNGTQVSSTVISKPIDEIDAQGSKIEPIYTPPAQTTCAVTLCADGSCSYSTGRGTCSWHGGEAY